MILYLLRSMISPLFLIMKISNGKPAVYCIPNYRYIIYAVCIVHTLTSMVVTCSDEVTYTRTISAVVAVLTGCQPKGLQCNIGRTFCNICDKRAIDNSLHVLLKCDALNVLREACMNSILQSMPDNMKTSYSQLTDAVRPELRPGYC